MEELTQQERELLADALKKAAATYEPAMALGYGCVWRNLICKLGIEALIGVRAHVTDSGVNR